MAAGILSKPGTEYGPCAGRCNHKDCAEVRQMAAATCRICRGTIGYDRRFYDESGENKVALVHASCRETEVEAAWAKERAAAGEVTR